MVFLSYFLSLFLIFPPKVYGAGLAVTAVFRPWYSGGSEGTVALEPDINTSMIDREWNLEGWNITKGLIIHQDSKMEMKLRLCVPTWWVDIGLGQHLDLPFYVNLFVSTDRGETFPYEFSYEVGYLRYTRDRMYAGFCYNDWTGDIAHPYWQNNDSITNPVSLFSPTTRIIIAFHRGYPTIYPTFYFANIYWGSTQKPVPPYDYKDVNGTYVQYHVQFFVQTETLEQTYVKEYQPFTFTETKTRMINSANMILNTMFPSGCSNEITGKAFGGDAWVVLYSSELAMMSLIDLCQYVPENKDAYLIAVKRFIHYLFSKQNLTDGSFPFILTDGDQHPWTNPDEGLYYGYDKIDSFSACAISLLAKYHNATGDTDTVVHFWNQLVKCKDFIWDLTNTTSWIPVDGYHYNGTIYTKSEWTWTHDTCEGQAGYRDYAYLCGVMNNTADETYFIAVADAVANGIRTKLWNETEHRYVGLYNVLSDYQDTTRVYCVICPIIYGIETNVTRAVTTVNDYVMWGILSGRYYDKPWAPDYSVYNEYSTMSGMIQVALYRLLSLNYTNVWMKTKYLEISKFLFTNPIYPTGDLQSPANGWLDYVNLVNYTWAPEYARLVEGSGWLINGFLLTPNCSSLYSYSPVELMALNETLKTEQQYWDGIDLMYCVETGKHWTEGIELWEIWLKGKGLWVQWYDFQFLKYLLENGYLGDLPWWEEWNPDDDWWKRLEVTIYPNYVPLIAGLIGVGMVVLSPAVVVHEFHEHDYAEGFAYGTILMGIGIGLMIFWLWG